MGFHVDTNVLSAESHNCGISSFLPNFTLVRGIDDRYLLSFVCVLPYVAVNTSFSTRVILCGIEGCLIFLAGLSIWIISFACCAAQPIAMRFPGRGGAAI